MVSLVIGVGAGYFIPRGGGNAGDTSGRGGGAGAGGPGNVRKWVPKEVGEFLAEKLGGWEYIPDGSGGIVSPKHDIELRVAIRFKDYRDDDTADRARRNHIGPSVALVRATWVFITDTHTAAKLRPLLEQMPE